jgi:hypothetical protein
MAGCGIGSGANSQAVSEEVGVAAGSEATVIATSMTQTDVIETAGTGSDAARSLQQKPENVNSCASIAVTGKAPDGSWTAETLTFAAPPCIFTGARGFATLDVTGVLALTRSADEGYSFTSNATNLEYAFNDAVGNTYSETRNGTRAITASSTGASAASNINVAFVGARHDGTLNHQMTSTFTPDAGLALAPGEPLPSGTFVHNGTVTWMGSDGNTGTFAVTTVTPLAYDSTCRGTQPSVFDSGELQIQKTTDTANKVTTIVWSGCGTPTVTYVSK